MYRVGENCFAAVLDNLGMTGSRAPDVFPGVAQASVLLVCAPSLSSVVSPLSHPSGAASTKCPRRPQCPGAPAPTLFEALMP